MHPVYIVDAKANGPERIDAPERAQANPPADHLEAAPAVRAESDPPAVAVPDPVP